jgi:hypothetical protein
VTTSYDALLRLRAWHQGRAQVRVTRQQVRVQPHAMMLAPVKMAGEDVTIFACGWGSRRGLMRFDFVADPRNRDAEYALFARLGAVLARYFAWCQARGCHPQVWVASPAAVRLLDLLADRLRYAGAGPAAKPAEVVRFGEHLTHLVQRAAIPGNQTLLAATEVLGLHFATGQQPAEDAHLGAFLAWIDPPQDQPLEVAVAQAEATPMGVLAQPDTDNLELAGPVAAWNAARRRQASPAALDALAGPVGAVLRTVVTPIFKAIGQAIDAVDRLGLPELASLDGRVASEERTFTRFLAYLDRPDHRFALRDRPLPAALGLLEREAAATDLAAELAIEDPLCRAQAASAGAALTATLVAHKQTTEPSVGPTGRRSRRQVHTITLRTAEADGRLRPGDTFRWLNAPGLVVRVDDFTTDPAGGLQIAARVIGGFTRPGVPPRGTVLELVAAVPERWRFPAKQAKVGARLMGGLPWPHDPAQAAPAASGRPHPDPLAVVERLRAAGGRPG